MTRQVIVTFCCVLTLTLAGAQETKFVVKNNGGTTEEYYVLKTDKSKKHGSYVNYRTPFDNYVIIESGSYNLGEKHGEWQYFYNHYSYKTWNNMREKGSYVNGKRNGIWTTFYMDTVTNTMSIEKVKNSSNKKSFDIDIEQKNPRIKQVGMYLNDKRVGEWISFNFDGEIIQKYDYSTAKLLFERSIVDSAEYLNRKPVFIGGRVGLSTYLAENFKYSPPVGIVEKGVINLVASFEVDTTGRTRNIQIDSTDDKVLETEITRVIDSMDSYWTPAIKDGKPVSATYKLGFDLVQLEISQTHRKWTVQFKILE